MSETENEDAKIDILNGSLKLWNKTDQNSLELAFRTGLTASEAISIARVSIEGVHSVHGNAGRLEWLSILISLANLIDNNKSIFYLQTDSLTTASSFSSEGILIHVIGPTLVSNNIPNISFSKSHRDENGENETLSWKGPVVPIRYCHITAKESRANKFRDSVSQISPQTEVIFVMVREDALQIALSELQSTNETKLKLSCLEAFQNNPSLSQNNALKLSFLYVKSNQEVVPIKELLQCANIGCTVKAEKMCRCVKCRTPYCGKECQVAHWPLHKRVCKNRQKGIDDEAGNSNYDNIQDNNNSITDNGDSIEADATESRPFIMIDATPDPDMYDDHLGRKGSTDSNKDTFTMGISMCGGIAVPRGQASKSKKLPFRAYEFIVKVQGTPTGASILIYDENRIIHLNTMSPTTTQPIHQFTSRYREPYPGVSIHPGNMKIFLYARVVQGDLRLFLDRIAQWQNW